jgi:CheY-like chemotaxis protein/anti-sigma regulatory factor (Ser/Thr protein kinase)
LGKVELRKERFALAAVVQSALEINRPLLDACRHDFVMDLPDEPMWVHADPGRLAQIVANLLNNAAKYTMEGGHIKLIVQQEGREVVLRVQDDGIGITADMLPKIFALFTQGDTSPERARGGLGVGLSLVKNLVQLHGGTVAVRSAGSGCGSEFIVRLPIGVDGPEVAGTKAASESLSLRHLRILVVDDNVDSAESFAMLLRQNGHEVRTAYDGPSALKVAAEYAPEIVLQDIGLPGMNGYEVARRLRQHPATATSLLVAVSGYAQADDLQRSQATGFDHHLLKPLDFDELARLLAIVGEPVR